MITNRQKNFIAILSSKALFLGVGFSLILDASENDTWICFILGSLLGILFTYFLKKILDYKKNRTLTQLLKEMSFIGVIIRILLILFSVIIINEILFVLQIFAKSFFLINSNTFLIVLPLVILAIYAAFKGYKIIAYVSECIFPIAIFFTAFAILGLFFKIDLSNLKPILSHSNFDMLKGIFYYFSLSTIPLLFLLDMEYEDNSLTKSYIFSTAVLTGIAIVLLGILGQFLVTIYRFPEYIVLKDIELFGFIEKVENIISISWIIDNFILLCLSSCFLKRILPQKYNNYSFLTIIISIFAIVCLIFGNSYIQDLNIYLYFPHIISIIAIPIVIILFIYCILKKK